MNSIETPLRGPAPLLLRALRSSLLFAVILAALAYLLTALIAVANFGFRYPAFDQYRLYPNYLGLPFPQNAIQLENGHRPILPILVRLAEIRWFDANQLLQIATGIGAALLACGLVILALVRERSIPALARAAACLFVVVAVFWLGNARMLMHGNELDHVYFVLLATVGALLAVDAAKRRHAAAWTFVAALCCLAATFSFGAGIASFVATIVLGLVLRLRKRDLAILGAALAVAAIAYLSGLPGTGGVRGSLLLDPAANLSVLARWLAAPWMRAWLGQGDPPTEPWLQSSMLSTQFDTLLVVTARWISAPFGANAPNIIAAIIGSAGLVAYLIMLAHCWRSATRPATPRVLALGLSTFAFCAAAIVCIARLHYFQSSPMQIYADRYLPWSCLFWLGLALYPIAGGYAKSSSRGIAYACTALFVALVLVPSHRSLAGWSATVSRHIQQSAVAAQLGIWDPQRFGDASASDEDVAATLDLLKEHRLSMYAEPAFDFVEKGWHAPMPLPSPLAGGYARVAREFDDPHSKRHIADFEGWMPRIADLAKDPVISVVDANGTLRGLAKMSFIGPGKRALRFNVARKRGFDGYVLDAHPGEQLSVVVLDPGNTRIIAAIPLMIPDTDSAR